MTYTRQEVLDRYNTRRGTSFSLVQLGTYLLNEKLKEELRSMLREDAAALEGAQVDAL
jgi:hypothetical protein